MKWYDVRVNEMNELDSTWGTDPIELNYLLSGRLNELLDKVYLKDDKMVKFTEEEIDAIGVYTPFKVIDQLEEFVYNKSNNRELRVAACKKLDFIYDTKSTDPDETDDELLSDWVNACKLNGVGEKKIPD
jgi:hypothetical protein